MTLSILAVLYSLYLSAKKLISYQADLGDRRVVSPKAGAEAAAALGLQYFESSAKDQTGVEVRIGQNFTVTKLFLVDNSLQIVSILRGRSKNKTSFTLLRLPAPSAKVKLLLETCFSFPPFPNDKTKWFSVFTRSLVDLLVYDWVAWAGAHLLFYQF